MSHLQLENLNKKCKKGLRSIQLESDAKLSTVLPLVYQTTVTLDLHDTFLNTTTFSRGVAIVNDFILGRYWPVMGPQQTLFVPAAIRNSKQFTLTLVEFEKQSEDARIDFLDFPILDAY